MPEERPATTASAIASAAPVRKRDEGAGGIGRFSILPPAFKGIFLLFTIVGLALFCLYVFSVSFGQWVLEPTKYYYLLYVVFMLPIFLVNPARRSDKKKLPWYDIVIGCVGAGTALYFYLNADAIAGAAWLPPPNTTVFALGVLMLIISIEAGRRVGGWIFVVICSVFGAYPLVASYMPGPLYGVSLTFPKLVGQFAFSTNGILGLPAQVNGDLVIGYLFFSGVMVASGAGAFFLDLAMGLMGRFRGGPAKVSVIASALFGSLSASSVANVVAIGSVTIPAMKKLGYPAHYAGAIEACASTGDAITPPVMGTIAFIMAILTGIDYSQIVIAATIPAILYFFGLLVQVDGYAARVGMVGMRREDVPSLKETLRNGWVFIIAFAFLIWALIAKQWTAQGPVYASVIMILLSFTSKKLRLTPRRLVDMLGQAGSLVAWMIGILLPVGLIITGLTVTGTTASLISMIAYLSEANTFLVLLITFVTCYLLGMIGLGLIPYLFLAVTMAPAVVKSGGLDLIGVHLFLVYNVILAGITPPVAMLSFVAAAVAGAPPMKTAWMSMRLGVVLIFIPFFFIYNPAFLLRGPNIVSLAWLLPLCLLGIWVLTSGLEGYLLLLGALPNWARAPLVIGGFLIAIPWGWVSAVVGVAIAAATVTCIIVFGKVKRLLPSSG